MLKQYPLMSGVTKVGIYFESFSAFVSLRSPICMAVMGTQNNNNNHHHNTYIHNKYIHTYIHTYIHDAHPSIHASVHPLHTYIHTYIHHTYIPTYIPTEVVSAKDFEIRAKLCLLTAGLDVNQRAQEGRPSTQHHRKHLDGS